MRRRDVVLRSVARRAACAQPLSRTDRRSLPRGGSYVLDPDPTVGSAAIGLWFRAPARRIRRCDAGVANLAATAAAVAPLASGKSLYALVHTLGGELNIEVYPDIVGIGAVVPASASRRDRRGDDGRLLRTFSRRRCRENGARQRRRSRRAAALRVGYDAARSAVQADLPGGPAHYPPLPTSVVAAHEHLDGRR